MPLLDHYHTPGDELAPDTSIDAFWVVNLCKWINSQLLPYGYRAYARVYLGPIESDITEYEIGGPRTFQTNREGPLASVLIPPPAFTIENADMDVFEIQIHKVLPTKKLVAVIEVLSYANKHRESARQQLVSKCINLLRNGVGVVIVDIITNRRINLHNDIVERLGGTNSPVMENQWTYVAAYRPTDGPDSPGVEVWPYPAVVGEKLPEVPVPIVNGPPLLLDLEGTYLQTIQENGINPPGA